jgi:hypothetical protein
MAQQAETADGAAQDHDRHPCEVHHQRDRSDMDAEQIDLEKYHAFGPMSKYSGCLVSTQRLGLLQPRQRSRRLPEAAGIGVSLIGSPREQDGGNSGPGDGFGATASELLQAKPGT